MEATNIVTERVGHRTFTVTCAPSGFKAEEEGSNNIWLFLEEPGSMERVLIQCHYESYGIGVQREVIECVELDPKEEPPIAYLLGRICDLDPQEPPEVTEDSDTPLTFGDLLGALWDGG